MLKITFGQLRDQNFGRAFSTVTNFGGYKSPQTVYNLAKISKKVREEAELCEKLHLAKLKEHCALNDKGEPATDQAGRVDILPEKLAAWEAALKEFNAVEVELPHNRIKFEDAVQSGCSPLGLSYLDCLLTTMLEEVK